MMSSIIQPGPRSGQVDHPGIPNAFSQVRRPSAWGSGDEEGMETVHHLKARGILSPCEDCRLPIVSDDKPRIGIIMSSILKTLSPCFVSGAPPVGMGQRGRGGHGDGAPAQGAGDPLPRFPPHSLPGHAVRAPGDGGAGVT
jgi:hypothetical protein